MATEGRNGDAPGLVRRAGGEVGRIFDAKLSVSQRVGAGAKVAGVGSAATVAGVLGLEHINALDPSLVSALGTGTGDFLFGAGASAVVLAVGSMVTGIVADDAYGRQAKLQVRTTGRNFFGHGRTACLVAGGALGLTAAGFDAGQLVGLGHNAALAQGLAEWAVVAAGAATVNHVGRELWSTGLPKPAPPRRSLSE